MFSKAVYRQLGKLTLCSILALAVLLQGNSRLSTANASERNSDKEAIEKTVPTPQPILDFMQAEGIDSLKDYVEWMQINIAYFADEQNDQWADPKTTLNNRGGDCEDLAFLHAAVLKELGYEPRVLAHSDAKSGHVFVMAKVNGRYFVIDNINFVPTKLSDLKQVSEYLYKKHKTRYLLELKREPRQVEVLYEVVSNEFRLVRGN